MIRAVRTGWNNAARRKVIIPVQNLAPFAAVVRHMGVGRGRDAPSAEETGSAVVATVALQVIAELEAPGERL